MAISIPALKSRRAGSIVCMDGVFEEDVMPNLKRTASMARRADQSAAGPRAHLAAGHRARPTRPASRATGSSLRATLPPDQRWMVAAYGD